VEQAKFATPQAGAQVVFYMYEFVPSAPPRPSQSIHSTLFLLKTGKNWYKSG
jgi:hypothetical protein